MFWPFSLRQFGPFACGRVRILKCAGLVKNKLSEKSVATKEEDEELEKYKKNLDLMLNSDKALYLNTFRAIFGTLLFMCVGAIVTTLRHSEMLAVARPESPGALAMLDMAAIMMLRLQSQWPCPR